MRTGKIEIWKSEKDGKWYAHLKGANGRVIAASEGYNSKAEAGKWKRRVSWSVILAPVIFK